MTQANTHHKILKSLYELFLENMDNKEVLDRISTIAWSLEFDMGFDNYGYFELSELSKYSNQANARQHYIEIIEQSLKNLGKTKS